MRSIPNCEVKVQGSALDLLKAITVQDQGLEHHIARADRALLY